jgi:hypothetical protein
VPKKPSTRKNKPRPSWIRRVLLFGALAALAVGALVCITYAFWASTYDMEGGEADAGALHCL